MNISVSALVGPVFGGALVVLITYWTNRPRVRAEIEKLHAESERTRAETTQILLRSDLRRSRTADEPNLPKGWLLAGSHPEDYGYGTDTEVFVTGHASGFIQALPQPRGFTSMAQWIKAEAYRGKRVRLSAVIKTRNVVGWAGLWLRVDTGEDTVAFDNTETPHRRLSGTSGWQQTLIVLDVPVSGEVIAFGFILDGEGRAWIDDVRLECVDTDVPLTAVAVELASRPVNLNFEAGIG